MIAPKILEPDRTGSRSAGEGADCFALVKMFGSRIFWQAKYITETDADVEAVLVETFLKACADGSGSQADEGMRARLATIAVRAALAKLSYRGRAEGEENLPGDVVIREIFVWGDNHHSPEQTNRNSRASHVKSRSDLPGGIRTPGYRGDPVRTNGTRTEPLRTCLGSLPFEGTSAASREAGTELSAGSTHRSGSTQQDAEEDARGIRSHIENHFVILPSHGALDRPILQPAFCNLHCRCPGRYASRDQPNLHFLRISRTR